jgi:carboxymethylenebutenolidase
VGIRTSIGGVTVYRAEPTAPLRGALLLIEEIWGLVPHIESVADRFAAEGWLVWAPELLGDVLGTRNGQLLMEVASDPDVERRTVAQTELRQLFSSLGDPKFAAETVAKLRTLVDALEAEPAIEGRIAVTGFCFGGTYAFALAAADSRIRAAVPFYGSAPSPESIAKIKCPVHAFYGVQDTQLIEALPIVQESFTEVGGSFIATIYHDTGHAFFNDTNPRAYNAADAEDAWIKATAFLNKHV